MGWEVGGWVVGCGLWPGSSSGQPLFVTLLQDGLVTTDEGSHCMCFQILSLLDWGG